MITKIQISELNKLLMWREKRQIASISNLSDQTISNFFNGKENLISEDTQNKIVSIAFDVIESRNKSAEEIGKKISLMLI